jgi:hypothetical protein|nr:MAG TPA: hypothetical protein [Caudoviricetes sp.]
MKLKVQKSISKRIINLEIETASFTPDENKMLDILGEPIIKFEKIYGDNLAVSFEKRIRTGFKIKVRFDGTENIVAADAACDKFLEDLPEELAKAMEKLKMLYDDIDGKDENKPPKYIDIVY